MSQRIKSIHRTIIHTSPEYVRLVECIRDGCFTWSRKPSPSLIRLFQALLSNVSIHPIPSNTFVYRGLRKVSVRDKLIHDLPFSTTLSKSFAIDWVSDVKVSDRSILCFSVRDIPCIYLGFEDEEKEVVLPPGTFHCDFKVGIFCYGYFIPKKNVGCNK